MKKIIYASLLIVISSLFFVQSSYAQNAGWVDSPSFPVSVGTWDPQAIFSKLKKVNVIDDSGTVREKSVVVKHGQSIDMAHIDLCTFPGLIVRLHGDKYYRLVAHDGVTVKFDIDGKNCEQDGWKNANRGFLMESTNFYISQSGSTRIYDNITRHLKPRHRNGGMVTSFTIDNRASEYQYVGSQFDYDESIMGSIQEPVTPRTYQPIVVDYSGNGRYVFFFEGYDYVVRYDRTSGLQTLLYIPGGIRGVSYSGDYVLSAKGLVYMKECGRRFYGNFGTAMHKGECRTKSLQDIMGVALESNESVYGVEFARADSELKIRTAAPQDADPDVPIERPRLVTLRNRGVPHTPRLKYLAMGDSYSSGEGDIEGKGAHYFDGTQKKGRCHQSRRSYPYLLGKKWGLDDNEVKSVACSGARIVQDYISSSALYEGQITEGGVPRLAKYKEAERSIRKLNALSTFYPGENPQIEFVKKYEPEMITVTGGGNDANFGGVLVDCVAGKIDGVAGTVRSVALPCSHFIPGSKSFWMMIDGIVWQQHNMGTLIREIKRVSPNTKIHVIGYPKFVNDDFMGGCLNAGLLDPPERKALTLSIKVMNMGLRHAARIADVAFIDVENTLKGGRLCESSVRKYVTGIGDVIDVYRLGALEHIQNAFHPNHEGHAKLADRIDLLIEEEF